jgi:hypothetical protein
MLCRFHFSPAEMEITMATYLYLSMTPEALVASMLKPSDFGTYLATGTRKNTHGRAMFFDLQPDFQSDHFDLSHVRDRCVPHADGTPKHSVYLSIYRVLEHVPPEAINSLWLTTKDGRVLELNQETGALPKFLGSYYLYQEICPVHPLIASTHDPEEFLNFITDPAHPIHIPRICFVDLELGLLADDPTARDIHDLPYAHMDHIRDCLAQMEKAKGKYTKTVNRTQPEEFPYRCIRSGFYLGNQDNILYFPFPAHEQLDVQYHEWWRSAVNV